MSKIIAYILISFSSFLAACNAATSLTAPHPAPSPAPTSFDQVLDHPAQTIEQELSDLNPASDFGPFSETDLTK